MRFRGLKEATRELRETKRRQRQVFSLRRKLRSLRGMIPGCDEVDIETLLQRTADHIAKLKLRVHALKSLLKLYKS
ncbi:hypothetical protein BT93_C0172 [Corymbia citriodora subsp. variegata]|nr:hypothetical protein BT93_C0172 [Corymbia citriodora subsp. variegata]